MQEPKKRTPSGIAIELQIDGEVWHRVPSLENSVPDDRHFVLTTDEAGTTTVRFGDGEHGARLPTGADRVVAAYRSSKRFVAVVQEQGRVIVDKDWNESGPTGRLFGVYRGVVTNNSDPTSQSRVQAQVAAVLGNQPVWAMPCRPVGAATAVPAVGASVWVAFEGGDPSLPVWMGITQ